MAFDTGPGLRMRTGDCRIFCTRFLPASKCWNNKVLPTPAQIITKPRAQAVDPTGEESLDDAIT
jgi:hypothetical protein